LIAILSKYSYENLHNSLFLVASFGALAVLVYGVPQAELSQPLICWADMLFLQRLLFRYAFYPHFTLAQWCYHINGSY
ncbi:MAG: hypothetical protein ACI892_000339, partial [Marinobacter maritimus]